MSLPFRLPTTLAAGGLLTLAVALAALAEPIPLPARPLPRPIAEMDEAERQLEIARLRLRLFERVDYPLRMQQMDADIAIEQARRASLYRRIEEYERFDTNAFFVTLENTRLQLLETELRLRALRKERVLMQIYHQDERRLRALELQRAELQVRVADEG